jgi:hypothetical protein
VGMGSGIPEVPELLSDWRYNWATRLQGDINSGDWPSRFGGGGVWHKTSDLISNKNSQLDLAMDRKAWSDLFEKAKTHKGF